MSSFCTAGTLLATCTELYLPGLKKLGWWTSPPTQLIKTGKLQFCSLLVHSTCAERSSVCVYKSQVIVSCYPKTSSGLNFLMYYFHFEPLWNLYSRIYSVPKTSWYSIRLSDIFIYNLCPIDSTVNDLLKNGTRYEETLSYFCIWYLKTGKCDKMKRKFTVYGWRMLIKNLAMNFLFLSLLVKNIWKSKRSFNNKFLNL